MCHWYSYNVNHDLCVHWKNCEIHDEQTEYVSGQSECPNNSSGKELFGHPETYSVCLSQISQFFQ